MKYLPIIIFLSILMYVQTAFAEQEHIGNIKNLSGDVKIIRGEEAIIPVPGTKIFQTDTIKTGTDGTTGIILLDNTSISLGNKSELKLDSFQFDPPRKKYSLVTRMLKGSFIFVSGLMSKISPESVELKTPDGSVTIRGTKVAIEVKGEEN